MLIFFSKYHVWFKCNSWDNSTDNYHRCALLYFYISIYLFIIFIFRLRPMLMFRGTKSKPLRVSMQCMQSAILPKYVRPSVRPVPVLCLKEWTYRHIFTAVRLVRVSFSFSSATVRRYNTPRATSLSDGVKYTGL